MNRDDAGDYIPFDSGSVDLDPQAHATLALGIDPEVVDEHLALVGGVGRGQLLDQAEAQKYHNEVHQTMLEELQRWLSLGAFERMPKHLASNVIDARWALKWNNIDDKWRIQARLVVEGSRTFRRPNSQRSRELPPAGANASSTSWPCSS